MVEVTVRDLRNNSAQLLARIARGESLVVTRDGDPVAQLVPLPRRTRNSADLVARRRHLPSVDPAALTADIDALVDPRL